jgi:hypothetical protein
VNGLLGMAQGQLGLVEKGLAGLGGDDAARCALQQPGREFDSRRLICWLSADCTMSRSSAARLMEPSSTIRTK